MPQQTLTVVCRLNPSPEQITKLDKVLRTFAEACKYINSIVSPKITNKNRIQKEAYKAVRQQYGLTANLAVRACARVAANRKVGNPVKDFQPTSVDYDARIFDYKQKTQRVSLSTLDGREQIPLVVSNYQVEKLKGRKPTSATLCKRKDGRFYIHIQVKEEVSEPQTAEGVLGVDLGRTDIAHTSEGDHWNGQQLNKVRDHYSWLRAVLQHKASKGTRSSRRRCRGLLQRLSGREKRFQTWVNHLISKTIVSRAKATNRAIALEDLTGIRERVNQQPRNKTERRRSNCEAYGPPARGAFYQLRLFLQYKAARAGVKVVLVPPAYTSQTCHRCFWIGKRERKTFHCLNPACLWTGDADYNGASVIARLGAAVNQPGGLRLACQLQGY